MTAAATGPARAYETVFIAPPTLSEADVDKLVDEVRETFASRGAEITLVEKWGRRKLAYRVKKQGEGWYVLLHVKGSGDAIAEAERRMRISDNVMKYLTVRLDDVPGAVDAAATRLVRRAKQEEERVQRAAERVAQDGRDQAERARRRALEEGAPDVPDEDDDEAFDE